MRRAMATCLVVGSVGVSLAGCGYDRGDRALSGALGGAAVGDRGGDRRQPLVGAAIGGGADAHGVR
jgi:hypothetical protein